MTLCARFLYWRVKLSFLTRSQPAKATAYGALLILISVAAVVFRHQGALAVKSFWHASVVVWLKVIAYGAIPIVLAIFGAIYAAEAMPSKRAKRMVRLGFIVLGIACVIMTSYVETKSENEHRSEVAGLKTTLTAVQSQNTQILQHFVVAAPDAQTREISRREGILTLLRHEWILSHKNVSPGLLAGTEQPPSNWVNQRLKQLGETWSVEGTPPGPPITTGISYGNLKERCANLAMQITYFVRHRYDHLQNAPAYAKPLTPEKVTEWNRSNDAEFRQEYLSRVIAMHDEFAALHIRDPRLDDILNKDRENAQERLNPQFAWAGWIGIDDIKQIAASLEYFAGRTPK